MALNWGAGLVAIDVTGLVVEHGVAERRHSFTFNPLPQARSVPCGLSLARRPGAAALRRYRAATEVSSFKIGAQRFIRASQI